MTEGMSATVPLHPFSGILTLSFDNWERYHDFPEEAGIPDKH
jgi:hypothetical protein